jgi:iron complex transport system substrate-binding protein
MMNINTITGAIVDAAYRLHEEAGPGLLESVYEIVLAEMLESEGFRIRRQVDVPIKIGGKTYNAGFRADIIVNDLVIVEVKSVEHLARVHKKQVMTYLKLTGIPVGLLINFGGELLKGNIERLSLPSAPPLPPLNP